MPSDRTMLTVRISEDLRDRLEAHAKRTGQSKGAIVKDALRKQLEEMEQACQNQERVDPLMKYAAAGVRLYGGRPAHEIDSEIDQFRGDE